MSHHDPLFSAFGSTIRTLRIRRCLTQREFASLVGVGRQHVIRVEGGRTNPTLRLIAAMASALDLSKVDLVRELETHELAAMSFSQNVAYR
jgi:transcriptional regulator with XRE-family HTH domain